MTTINEVSGRDYHNEIARERDELRKQLADLQEARVRSPLTAPLADMIEHQEKVIDGLRAEVERLTRERDEARDLSWFWEIVDRDGLNNVCSDERGALTELVRYAARAEAADQANERLRKFRDKLLAENIQLLDAFVKVERKLAMAVEVMKLLPKAQRRNADGEYMGWRIYSPSGEISVNYVCHRIMDLLAALEKNDE